MAEARFLLDDKNDWDGAYYLAGYAVEFALKACVISRLMGMDCFPGKTDANNFYSHNLRTLRQLARLEDEMKRDVRVDSAWEVVQGWSEQSRYTIGTSERSARDLCDAIEREVVPWIKARW